MKIDEENHLLAKFKESEEEFNADLVARESNNEPEEQPSIAELIKLNGHKAYAMKNMTEEIVLWKKAYKQEFHERDLPTKSELKLQKLVRWINPVAHTSIEFERNIGRDNFRKCSGKILKLLKNELFGFLNFGDQSTRIIIGEDVLILRFVEKNLISSRDRMQIELDFLNQQQESEQYDHISYHERYTEVDGKDTLVIGVRITLTEPEIKLHINKEDNLKSVKVRSIRRRPEVNV